MRFLAPTREVDWVVYAKRPFAGPEQVLDYVGRYTHRVAISNNRLLDIADGNVTFRYKDYRHNSPQKTITLKAEEFIRRFCSMCSLTASSASATTASWETVTAKRNWRAARNCWACRRVRRPSRKPSTIIETAMKNSPVFP